MVARMAKGKPAIGELVATTILCWTLALYLLITGDPTHILISGGKLSGGGLRDPLGVASGFFIVGAIILCIALWKRYLAKP
jgi:hypothetical protein